MKGKIEVCSKIRIESRKDLSLVYTPGVAQACIEIAKNKDNVYNYTSKGNIVAIVTDGSAVLGLGNIGPEAALPVMEGKAVLFKEFGGVDAFPICLDTQDVEDIIHTVKRIAPGFGAIQLEDIAAPRCFEIEDRLKKELNIPVFHDDQHGTAIVLLAALINALKVVKKKFGALKVVVLGAGAAGTATTKILKCVGYNPEMCTPIGEIIVCDRDGIIYEGRPNLNAPKREIASYTNRKKIKGTIADAVEGADVLIGVAGPDLIKPYMIQKMAKDPIVFAMANPVPEIMPDQALEAGAAVVATGRSDFPNQINNVLAFPGLFKGVFEAKAKTINTEMELAAVHALADFIKTPSKENIIADALDKRVVPAVAEAVKKAALRTKADI
ncbi:NADP-dependent malic enzyme [Candidatus Woesearchaeota archaeon]|nr:NADP-dependent malic enzyme [Candidatus Woesearchaeota archaeon]